MFDRDELQRVIDLQERSYRLLRWVGRSLDSQVVRFDHLHQAMSAAEAAEEWLRRHWANLPGTARPREEESAEFASLFASYLATSFELQPQPGRVLTSDCRCYCTWCAYLASGPHLKVKRLTRNARREARELKAIYLRQLAEAVHVELPALRFYELADDSEGARELALASYAFELVRRSRFASQGEGVLVLWREFAWIDHHPVRKFRLGADAILDAERRVVECLRAA